MTAPTLEAERAAPCPLCNSDQVQVCRDANNPAKDSCRCRECKCAAPLSAWNRRAAPVTEGVELPKQSIDTPEFRALLADYCDADFGAEMGYATAPAARDKRIAKLIAYIDGRTAGAAPDDVVEGLCNTLGEIDALACDGLMPRRSQAEMRMRFKQIINQARPAMLAAAPSQMDKGREGGK